MCGRKLVKDRWEYKGFEICFAPSIATGVHPEAYYVYLSEKQLYLCVDGRLSSSAWGYAENERAWYASREAAQAKIDRYTEKNNVGL